MWRVGWAFGLVWLLGGGICQGEVVDLISGLNRGQLWAEFRGAGDRAVTGVIGRLTESPLTVNIPPGTQFWAQAGGRQGQATIGYRQLDLRETRVASVTLQTCCTNLGFPEARATDIMIPVACPDPRMTQLLGLPGLEREPHWAIQIAVWAIANNPPSGPVLRLLRREPVPEAATFAAEMMTRAAILLRMIGLEPRQFRLFR